jgi:hypothetical protein
VDEDPQARRDVFELLARLLADPSPLGAALGAGLLLGGQVVDDLMPGEVHRIVDPGNWTVG